jgi:prophage regulatory protein
MQTGYTIKRSKEARAQFGNTPNSTWYEQIARGLMPPGIALGERSVGWPAHELDAIAAARIAGKTEDELRALVRDLIAARAHADKLAAE